MKRRTREEQKRRSRRTLLFLTYLCFLTIFLLWLLDFLAMDISADRWKPVQTRAAREPPAAVQEDYENQRIEAALLAHAVRLDGVTVSHYCTCSTCCGKDDGITASGRQATPGVTVAVDPDVIPLGSDVLVDYGDGEIYYYRADDTGGSIQGRRIDLCVSSHEEALQLGLRPATVYFIAEGMID